MAQLPNYLRSYRKRFALSQDEVALLMGTISGDKICRYERFTRVPKLETAIALEVILKTPFRELFPGLYRQIERDTAARARGLLAKAEAKKPTPKNLRKRQAFAGIINSASK